MPPLPVVNAKMVIEVLVRAGFVLVRQKGSHCILRNKNGKRAVVPMHGNQDMPRGTLRAILRDIEISAEEFIALLKKV